MKKYMSTSYYNGSSYLMNWLTKDIGDINKTRQGQNGLSCAGCCDIILWFCIALINALSRKWELKIKCWDTEKLRLQMKKTKIII
jgi:hypothetical protein